VGALTDKSGAQDRNEDPLFVLGGALPQDEDLLPIGLYVIADGMGGHKEGERASALAKRYLSPSCQDQSQRL